MSTKKDAKHEDPVEEVTKTEDKPSKADKREAVLFAGITNHALGGVNDLKFRGTVAECRDYFRDNLQSFRGVAPYGGKTWGQIVDAGTLELIDSTVSSVNVWEVQAWATT